MSEQNFKNHARLIPLWHYITPLVLLALLIGSIINLWNAAPEAHYSAALLVIVSLLLFIFWAYARIFALKAQDRAIRAEENFRHFVLTGKPFDSKLTMAQIIGLRFAGDDEFAALAKKAVDQNLSQKQIKQAVQNWRADNHRV